ELSELNNTLGEPVFPPMEIVDALSPSILADVLKNDDELERFDVAVDNISANSFFMGLVKGTNYNMVVHPDVEGTISLELNDVTIIDVMSVVHDVYGYPFKRRENLFQVYPGGLRSEVFHIDYLSVKRQGISETQVTNGQVTSSGSSNSGGSSNSSNNSSNSNSNSSQGSNGQGTIGAQIRTETNSDFWGELQKTLTVLIGEGDGKRVIVTPQAGIVVVRALPDEIATVSDFLRKAALIMRRQVVLEAKILEVQLNDGYQTGIDWSAFANVNGNALNFGVSGTSPVSSNALGGTFSGVLDADDFFGVIELLSTQGSVQVLSSPRISTVNNQKAVIKVGKDEFFVTDVSNTTTSTTGTTTNSPEVELTPFFSGIALDVTPQISEMGEIILHVHPSISEVEDQTKTITLGDQVIDLPLALSTIRETDSVVYARSGQVIVLGGLMQNKSIDNNAGTPILGNMPVIGHLFSQQRNSTVKNELVILLKPTIMGPDGSPENIHRSMKRFEQFRRELGGKDTRGTRADSNQLKSYE
ncbi:MAG: MSHA biogenesis protein MshL, partial [Oceanicoccus sp.]